MTPHRRARITSRLTADGERVWDYRLADADGAVLRQLWFTFWPAALATALADLKAEDQTRQSIEAWGGLIQLWEPGTDRLPDARLEQIQQQLDAVSGHWRTHSGMTGNALNSGATVTVDTLRRMIAGPGDLSFILHAYDNVKVLLREVHTRRHEPDQARADAAEPRTDETRTESFRAVQRANAAPLLTRFTAPTADTTGTGDAAAADEGQSRVAELAQEIRDIAANLHVQLPTSTDPTMCVPDCSGCELERLADTYDPPDPDPFEAPTWIVGLLGDGKVEYGPFPSQTAAGDFAIFLVSEHAPEDVYVTDTCFDADALHDPQQYLDEWHQRYPAPAAFTAHATAEPVYPEPGSPIPGQPGYVVATCRHRVAAMEWRAGCKTCERCAAPQPDTTRNADHGGI